MNRARGFTLVELLVAMAVLMLLLVILVGVYGGIDRTVAQVNARREAGQTARVALEWIGRDLERMRGRVPGDLWSVTTGTSTLKPAATSGPQLQIVTSSSAILSGSCAPLPHAAFWQMASDAGSGRGMALVGYFVRWIQDGSTKRPSLCRLYVSGTSADYQGLYASGTNWVGNTLLDNNAPGSSPSYKGWFADNVLSIWFRALDANGNPITTNAASSPFPGGAFDSRQGYSFVGSNGTCQVQGPALPASMEVAVVVVDAARLQGNSQTYTPAAGLGSDPAAFWDDIQKFMADPSIPRNIRDGLRVYSSRIPLRYAQ